MKLASIIRILASALGLAVSAQASTLISYLGQPTSNSIQLDTTLQRAATDFLTGGSVTSVTGVTLNLLNQDTIAHSVLVSLFTDNSGSPGTLVGTFDTPILLPPTQPDFADVSATTAGINLAPATPYWLVLALSESITFNHVNWSVSGNAAPNAGSVFSGISATQVKRSTNSGGSYANFTPGNAKMALTGDAVPEPSTAALLLGGCAVLLRGRNRRR